jgi:hypothetical protein
MVPDVPPAWLDNEACTQWADFAAIDCNTLFKAPLFAADKRTSPAVNNNNNDTAPASGAPPP